ncbi:MAG: metal ABC transporter ATP-binding protein [bacterium]
MNSDICIDVQHVSFLYNAVPVLKDIDLKIKKGDYVAIVGPNGAGKTTLLKIITGLLKPSSGRVLIYGEDISIARGRHYIGYIPQSSMSTPLHFPITVEEMVKVGRIPRLGIAQWMSREDKEAIKWAMQAMGITAYKKRNINSLSGGERQRVIIASALAGKPDILILDEPTAGVDIVSQEVFYNMLSTINKDYGITILIVSHDIATIAKEVKCMVCLNKALICHGNPEEIIKSKYMEQLYSKEAIFIHHEHA